MKSEKNFFIGLLLSLTLSGCHSEYHQRVEAELATGVREDSLFLGITFGMSPKDFFAHCWELNRQGTIREGTQNMSVMREVSELKHPAVMNFYPDFYEDGIYEMPVTYVYKAWAPWNKKLFADSLQQDVLALYQQQYGNDFMTVDHPKGVAYVRVDGNRRISVYKEDDSHVKVVFTDLLAERKKKEQSTQANL
ncbi:MAG: hypothetical protein WA960_14350 [Tunicatimonas sp.]